MNIANIHTVIDLNWINTELNSDKIIFLMLLYCWKCFIIDQFCKINTVIFLFITVKLQSVLYKANI